MFSIIDEESRVLKHLDARDIVAEEKNEYFKCELIKKGEYFGIREYKVTFLTRYNSNVFNSIHNDLLNLNGAIKQIEIATDQLYNLFDSIPFVVDKLEINCDMVEQINLMDFCDCYRIRNLIINGYVGKIYNISEKSSEIDIENVRVNGNIYSIEPFSFYYNKNLRSFKVKGQVLQVSNYAFEACYLLKEFEASDGVVKILNNAFTSCPLSEIPVSDFTARIGAGAFSNNDKLLELVIPSSVKHVGNNAFTGCNNLRKVVVESGDHNFDQSVFSFCKGLEIFEMTSDCTFCGSMVAFCPQLSNIIIDGIIVPKYKVLDLRETGTELLKYSIKNKLFMPYPVVANNLPKIYYSRFYEYSKIWQDVVSVKFKEELRGKNTSATTHEQLEAYFKLAFSLGLFEGDKQTVKAYKFLTKEFCANDMDRTSLSEYKKMNIMQFGFNHEFADFYLTNFHGANYQNGKRVEFLESLSSDGYLVKCASKIYNEWNKFKSFHPTKAVMKTNEYGSNYNALTEKNALNYAFACIYENIKPGMEEFALICSTYGYSQTHFETLQEQFLIGSDIAKNKEVLFIDPDIEDSANVTYKVLSRKEIRTAFTGERSNCCMTVALSGRFPNEYGLTKPNARFIEFYIGDMLVGSSLVWYNARNNVVCLDNIEIPKSITEKVKKETNMEESFVECLKRFRVNVKKAMLRKLKIVSAVAIGSGNNDLDILNLVAYRKPIYDKKAFLPKDYNGYSDAKDAVYYIEDF